MSSASHNHLVPTAPRTRGNKLQIPLTSRVVAPRRESREDGSGDIRERWPIAFGRPSVLVAPTRPVLVGIRSVNLRETYGAPKSGSTLRRGSGRPHQASTSRTLKLHRPAARTVSISRSRTGSSPSAWADSCFRRPVALGGRPRIASYQPSRHRNRYVVLTGSSRGGSPASTTWAMRSYDRPRSGDCRARRGRSVWGRRQPGVSVPLVTRRVTGVAFAGNDPSGWRGDAGLAPAAGLIRSLSALWA